MISIDLTSAIQRQVTYCLCYENYRCGIFLSQKEKFKTFSEAFAEFISFYDSLAILTRTSERIEVRFPITGSFIRVVLARENVRGYRVNGMIIDNDIKPELTQTVLLPYIIKRYSSEVGGLKKDDNPLKRVFLVSINNEDLFKLKIEKYRYKEIDIMNTFANEYVNKTTTWFFRIPQTPEIIVEQNNSKIMVYDAWGIPKDNIEYRAEFNNKTKETNLVINGEADIINERKNIVDIEIPIDTDIYDEYKVDIKDGMVTVTLYEIKNDAPKFEERAGE